MDSTMQAQPTITGHLSPELAQIFLAGLPEHIRNGLEMRAKTMNYPVWAVIEMAICQGHATRTQAISMKRLYPLPIVSQSSTSDRAVRSLFWDVSAGGNESAIALLGCGCDRPLKYSKIWSERSLSYTTNYSRLRNT